MTDKNPAMGPIARTIRQMRRDLWLQGAALLSLVISLTILGAYITLCLNFSHAYNTMATGSVLMAVMNENIQTRQGHSIAETLVTEPEILKAQFISKEKAIIRFANQLGPNAHILTGLSSNPLPPTIEIFLKPGVSKKPILIKIRNLPEVKEVLTTRPWLRKLEQAARFFWELALALGLLLFTGVVFLILNTVRMAIYIRKDQLEVMDLVGASGWFIRLPFCIEAMIQALLASLLASLAVWGLLRVLARPNALPLGIDTNQLMSFSWQTPIILSAMAILAGLMGGFLGVSKALRPKDL